MSYKKISNIASWTVFGIAMIVYFFSVERTGSLWDCGEFVSAAYKLQVVHPPGAPLFIIVGRMFAWVADVLSTDPSNIAFAINLMSGMFTAFAAFFVARITMIFGKLAYVGRMDKPDQPTSYAIAGAGLVAGLSTAFASSVWFSAVEGEVYAMSTFFTTLTFWAMAKWYDLPDEPKHDKWILFSVFAAGISIGVHLLSLLTFPALALLYYFKRYKTHSWKGGLISAAIGVIIIPLIQKLVIAGIPNLWSAFELFTVNSLGLPPHTGIIPTILLIAAIIYFGLRYAHRRESGRLQLIFASIMLVVIGFSTLGVVVIRSNANPPINMNEPDNAMALIPYLNREQYGERPILRGPYFDADVADVTYEDRYELVGDEYKITDFKASYEYEKDDIMFFPRMGHQDARRKQLYRMWMGKERGKPTQWDNFKFFFQYQIGWMYWRYFMWNFAGRQNGDQGFYPWDPSDGHWISGINFLDSWRLYNQDKLPDWEQNNPARNTYFLLPFIFGLIGLIFHYRKDPKDFSALVILFLMTGLGLIVYSNQPPNEPRERDYVLVGSFFTYCMWIGFGLLALFDWLKEQSFGATRKTMMAGLATAVVLSAPVLMGTQNFDDIGRAKITAARDYAINFLESTEPNAVIFTYGDNDTYPLWYAQEVENIRPDVRVINLSLIATDWYINQMRRKINESPPLNFTIPAKSYRGSKRNQVFYYNPQGSDKPMELKHALEFIGEHHPLPASSQRKIESYLPTKDLYIPVRKNAVGEVFEFEDSVNIVDRIPINLGKNKRYLLKDELAILDIIASNIWDRPIYFAVTSIESKLMNLDDYMQLEGLALRIVPVQTKSDNSMGIFGNGRVNEDLVYDRIMNDFKWGNFDQYDLFVDDSYSPTIQAHRMVFMRAALQFMNEGQPEKAADLAIQYFDAFPHMNFPYDATVISFIDILIKTGHMEEAKEHTKILAERSADQMEFFNSISQQALNAGFRSERQRTRRSINTVAQFANRIGEKEYTNEIQQLVGPYLKNQ